MSPNSDSHRGFVILIVIHKMDEVTIDIPGLFCQAKTDLSQ
jgi:hypothetical protein